MIPSDSRQTLLADLDASMAPFAPLPLWRKLLFSLAGFGRGMMLAIVQFFLITFLLEVAGIEAYWVGIIMVAKQVFDALTDPIVGSISDHTETRWGRRKPWVMIGIVPLFVFWVFLWYMPSWIGDSQAVKIVYVAMVVMLFSTAASCVCMPTIFLIPDAAPTYHERTSIVMYSEVMSKIGSAVASVFWTSCIRWFNKDNDDDRYAAAYAYSALVTAPLICTTIVLGVLAVNERPLDDNFPSDSSSYGGLATGGGSSSPDGGALRGAKARQNRAAFQEKGYAEKLTRCCPSLANSSLFAWFATFVRDTYELCTFKPFVVVALMNLFAMLAASLFVNDFYLWMKYVVQAEYDANYVLLVLQAALIVSMIFWMLISHIWKKHNVFVVGSALWISSMVVLYWVGPGDLNLLYGLIAARGFAAGSAYLMPQSMLADTIRLDELRSGKRREGLFYSLFLSVIKLAMAFSQGLINFVLGYLGYKAPDAGAIGGVGLEMHAFTVTIDGAIDTQPRDVLLALRILISPVPIVLLLGAIACAVAYPIVFHHAEAGVLLEQTDSESSDEQGDAVRASV